jgi:hypothetical protein
LGSLLPRNAHGIAFKLTAVEQRGSQRDADLSVLIDAILSIRDFSLMWIPSIAQL